MRRTLAIGLAVLLVAIVAMAAPVASAFIGIRPLVEADLGDGATQLVDGYVGVGLLPLDGGRWMLVDCGNDPMGTRILAALASRGATAGAVDAILLTHGHPDHVAGCPLFTDAVVYGLAAEDPYLKGHLAWRGPLPRLGGASDSGVGIARTVQDGETLTIGGRRITVFAVPGHTAGSAVYLTDGLLFLGDSGAIERGGGLRPAPWVFTDDTAQNRRSLRALAEALRGSTVSVLIPAHSGVADSSAPLMTYGGR